jgi:uncharacterized protein YfbU (UPF0304 family)
MDLNLKDRLILVNQYLILEKIDPEEAEQYALYRHALERGFSREYGEMTGHITEAQISENQCSELIDILDMYRHLSESYDEVSNKTGITKSSVEFPGFDGNDRLEGRFMSYVRYLVDEKGEWTELKGHKEKFNSHMPMLNQYKNMLHMHGQFDRNASLTKDQILSVIQAGDQPQPTRRIRHPGIEK